MIGRGMAKRCLEPIWRNGKDPKSSALDEDAEGPAEVFGMGQGLKLARAGGNPWFERGVAGTHPLDDAGQEPSLRPEFLGAQSFRLAGILDGAEVHMGGEVLFAGPREEVGGQMMMVICAQGAVLPFRREKFPARQPVIECDEFAGLQRARGLPPPIHSRRADFGGEAVGQYVQQFTRECQASVHY